MLCINVFIKVGRFVLMKTEIQRLDGIFFFLKNERRHFEFQPLRIEYLHRFDNDDEKELQLILNKLLSDGLIEKDITEDKRERYIISFNGLIFQGYENTQINERQNQIMIALTSKWVMRGTCAAAILAGLLLIWQIFVYIYPVHKDYPYFFWEKVPNKHSSRK